MSKKYKYPFPLTDEQLQYVEEHKKTEREKREQLKLKAQKELRAIIKHYNIKEDDLQKIREFAYKYTIGNPTAMCECAIKKVHILKCSHTKGVK